jgi:hypothetical protein
VTDALVAEPVQGFRSWSLVARRGDRREPDWELSGIGVGGPWEPDRHGCAHARCLAPDFNSWFGRVPAHRQHGAPVASCTCGFHLLKEPGADLGAVAEGEALGWGRLVEHAAGWRCEWSRPVRVAIDRSRLERIEPGCDPEAVAAAIRDRYRCQVDLVDPPPPVEGRRVGVSALLLVVASCAAPLLIGAAWSLRTVGIALQVSAAAFAVWAVLALRPRRG